MNRISCRSHVNSARFHGSMKFHAGMSHVGSHVKAALFEVNDPNLKSFLTIKVLLKRWISLSTSFEDYFNFASEKNSRN